MVSRVCSCFQSTRYWLCFDGLEGADVKVKVLLKVAKPIAFTVAAGLCTMLAIVLTFAASKFDERGVL